MQETVVSRHVVFSHGKESGPWGRKISALAEVARSEGYDAHSVDYRGIDEPRARVARLVEFCKELSGDLVLVGSSLGGYVAATSASLLHARRYIPHGAGTLPGRPAGAARRPARLPDDASCTAGATTSCPMSRAMRFAQTYKGALHLLESDHRLHNQLRVIQYLFEYFLIALDLPAIAFE